jgi:hypothetical protein
VLRNAISALEEDEPEDGNLRGQGAENLRRTHAGVGTLVEKT